MPRLPSLNYQMHERMEKLKCLGESRVIAKEEQKIYSQANEIKWNAARTVGIHSYKTYQAYKQTSKEFIHRLRARYPKIKDINSIEPGHVRQYLQDREHEENSAFTISKDMSALNKLFNFRLSKDEAGFKTRSYKNITRSRTIKNHDQKYNPENYSEQILFAKATGCRRQKILWVRPIDFIYDDNNQAIAVNFNRDKGGRSRVTTILKAYRAAITEMLNKKTVDKPLFERYTTMIDNHSFRSEYAMARYRELVDEKRYDDKDYRGYDRECVQKVSKDLGHNRLSVVVEHYFRK
ncbi:MAG: site-specific integrase [Eubacteriales bacterium]|nr:site-specific integrase [Eubacteriales bacterium]